MIQLAGLTPDEDIEVRITGLRPGEKLFEEIALEGEDMMPTYHEKIRIFKGPAMEADGLSVWLDQLQLLMARRDVAKTLSHLAALVPEYNPGRPIEARPKVYETTVKAATSRGVASAP